MKIAFTFLFFFAVRIASGQDCFLVVTQGGGIAGTATVYRIALDGTVLKGKGLGQLSFNEQSKVNKSFARKYYRKAKEAVGASGDFNHPGNMYYSLATEENKKETKLTWGDDHHPAPEQAKNVYQEITAQLAKLTFTTTLKK